MPEQTHPPYNITQPRILQRWLDVNYQNGPLKRCSRYFIIPPFTFTSSAPNLYASIDKVFCYSATNDFTITNPEAVLPSIGYFITISYTNDDLSVVRYALTENISISGVYLVTRSYIEPYTNQRIKKNFRIEVWNTGSANLLTEIKLYTSLWTNVDTRYGNDAAIATTLAVPETNFSVALPADLPIVFPNTITIN